MDDRLKLSSSDALIAVGMPLAVTAFLVDSTLPAGVDAGIFHITALLVAYCFPLRRYDLLILAATSTIFIVLGWFFSRSADVGTALLIANRSLSIVVLWGTATVLTAVDAPRKPGQDRETYAIKAAHDYAIGAGEHLKRDGITIGKFETSVKALRDHDFTNASVLTLLASLIDDHRRLEDVLAKSRAELREQLIQIGDQLNLGGSPLHVFRDEQDALESQLRMRQQFSNFLGSADARGIGTASRRSYRCIQAVAAYDQGSIPAPRSFRDVQCLDIGPDGFSFLAVERPTFDALVVGLGAKRDCIFLSAVVSRVEEIQDAGCHYYYVDCEFRGRLIGVGQSAETTLNSHDDSSR